MKKKTYWYFLLGLFLLGLAMIGSSLRYPWYTASEQAIGELSTRLANAPRDVRFREWYQERAKLDTPRSMLNDTGTGLLTLASILAILRLSTGFPLRDARSPRKRWLFVLIYLTALAAQVPASFWYFGLRQSRFEYPVWGDSIIIGISQTFIACVAFAVIGSLLWWPFLAVCRFPAMLLAWPANQRRFNLIVSLGFGAFAALSLIAVPSEVRDGNIGGILMAVVLMYLFLSLRAGLAIRQAEKTLEKNSEQSAAGYPPQSVGSPEP